MNRKDLIPDRSVLLRFSLSISLMLGIASGYAAQEAVASGLCWGDEVGGLRAAVRLLPQKAPYRPGDVIAVTFHVENVSSHDVSFTTTTWKENAQCIVEDSDGVEVLCSLNPQPGLSRIVRKTLAPGEAAIIEGTALGIAAEAAEGRDLGYPVGAWAILVPGRYHVRYRLTFPDAAGSSLPTEGDWRGTLETGPIELLVGSVQGDDVKNVSLNGRGFPKEARAVMVQFLNTLDAGDWAEALSFCSPAVKEEAATYTNLADFFNDFVPIKALVGLSWIPSGGGRSSRDGTPSALFCFVHLDWTDYRQSVSWQWDLARENTIWFIDFKLIGLDRWVAQEKERLQQERQQHKAKAQQIQDGLEVILAPGGGRFVLGQPMFFRVSMANKGDSQIEYETSQIVLNDPMIVTDPEAKVLPYIGGSVQTVMSRLTIEPGEEIVVCEKYDVTEQYHITKPGQYVFQLKDEYYGKHYSNVVNMNIQPGELSPRESIVESLATVIPDEWLITRNFIGSSERPDGLGQGQVLIVQLTGRKFGKPMGISILLGIFLEHDGGEIDLGSDWGEWGMCKWGPVFVKSYDAELLWPDWEKELAEALGIQFPE